MAASITKGQTFSSTETITNTKLHNLVDLATISGIVNAEIASNASIADTKLAQIATAGTVSGAALTSLANIPAGAGVIPAANSAANFVTGDWILSSVTTARSGWTNVSATYNNKFMRINATPLTTGGSDTDSITLTSTELPAHTHITTFYREGTGGVTAPIDRMDGGTTTNYTTSSTGTGSAFTVDTVPAYVQVCIFQKD